MSEITQKTVLDVLKAGTDYLAARKVEDARIACELLLARLLKCKRLELGLRHNQALDEPRLAAMRRGIKRVADGEPVQYVLGQVEFMGHAFKVDRRALIPRPETELLVERCLECESLWQRPKPGIADVGTGTGCIVISLAKARAHGLYVALDVSEEALALARENAAAHGLAQSVAFAHAELSDVAEPETFDAIVANPPYIRTADCEQLPVHIRDHEPRVALDGGPTGLAVVETIVGDAAIALRPGGFLFLEIGYDQGHAVRALLEQAGFAEITVHKDIAGLDRVVSAALANPQP
jgi:release factor glutamine methyltransferase